MRLDAIEDQVRWAGGIGALIYLGITYAGLWRATSRSKGATCGAVPPLTRRAFLLYVVAIAAIFGIMYRLWRPIRSTMSAPARITALIVGVPLYFAGLSLMIWGWLSLGEMYNVSTSFGAQLYADHRLVTTGPFAIVRHPMYLGAQLASLGSLLIYRTWAVAFATLSSLGLILRAQREEQLLAAEFGDKWREYNHRVPAWIPRLPI